MWVMWVKRCVMANGCLGAKPTKPKHDFTLNLFSFVICSIPEKIWLGMKAPAPPALPSQNCRARNLTSYFSLNSDTWIYICDIILFLGLNAITDTYIITTTRIILNLWTFWQTNRYESHCREFLLFYRFAWNKTYLRIHYHYQSMENTNSDACVILCSINFS